MLSLYCELTGHSLPLPNWTYFLALVFFRVVVNIQVSCWVTNTPTMVDKIPWDTYVITWIICVLKTEFGKALLFFFKIRFCPLPHPIQCWNSGEISRCTWGEGGAKQMQLNSHVTVCLARVKKRHKCKFVPRLLSMIVGVSWVSFYILYTFCSVEDEREKKNTRYT